MESGKLSHNEALLRQRESFDASRRSLQRALAERDEELESLRREMARNIQVSSSFLPYPYVLCIMELSHSPKQTAVEAKQQDFQKHIDTLEMELRGAREEVGCLNWLSY